jgi:hypothetical protein
MTPMAINRALRQFIVQTGMGTGDPLYGDNCDVYSNIGEIYLLVIGAIRSPNECGLAPWHV